MTNSPFWQDDYWPLLMQLYMRKPVGPKHAYCRFTVELALETHVQPAVLESLMLDVERGDTPYMRNLLERYAGNKRKLNNDAAMARGMMGFCNSATFYEGVETAESWEKDFRPLPKCGGLTPLMLILILDLYFRLTPVTMTTDTPEVRQLARLLGIDAQRVVEVMDVYRIVDPYLNRKDEFVVSPLLSPCSKVWQRYGNGETEILAADAAKMSEYFD